MPASQSVSQSHVSSADPQHSQLYQSTDHSHWCPRCKHCLCNMNAFIDTTKAAIHDGVMQGCSYVLLPKSSLPCEGTPGPAYRRPAKAVSARTTILQEWEAAVCSMCTQHLTNHTCLVITA